MPTLFRLRWRFHAGGFKKMAENKGSHFEQQLGFGRPKVEEKISLSRSTVAGNMRDQPKATKLIFSPKTAAKNVGKSDENSKSKSVLRESKVYKMHISTRKKQASTAQCNILFDKIFCRNSI